MARDEHRTVLCNNISTDIEVSNPANTIWIVIVIAPQRPKRGEASDLFAFRNRS
jgi:hypothetical protein